MASQRSLPQLSACIDLYLSIYDQFGTEPFTHKQIDASIRDDLDHLLDLSVAYGLFDFDESGYRVRYEPNASVERWQEWGTDRLKYVHDAIVDRSMAEGHGDSGEDDVGLELLVHDGEAFASVMVDDTDDFESLVDSVVTTVETDSCHNVVLRSAGELANQVQQFADRLCAPDAVAETALSQPFDKEFTDVVGNTKDDLEFRLYLAQA